MSDEFVDADLSHARFHRTALTGARFHDVDLTGAKITDALVHDVVLSGDVRNLVVNGVDVGPFVEAELDRRHPERALLRATDPDGLRAAWAAIGELWGPTLDLAGTLGEERRHERVDGEWSLVETLRHLLFAIDAWFGNAVLTKPEPFHPWGLAHTAHRDDGSSLGLDPAASPSFDQVVAARRERADELTAYLADVRAEALRSPRPGNADGSYPPPTDHTVLDCLHVVLQEEWWHHRFAARDLALLTGS